MLIDKDINGIRFVADKSEDVHSATIGVWVKAGCVYEDEANNGISHFIEHMLFKGTKNRNYKQIAEDIDNIGGQINAFTAKECTCYYAKVIDEHQDIAADVLFDMISNSIFPDEEMNKEKGVVLEEIAMSNDTPDDVSSELINSTFFRNTPLEKTILGPAKTVSSFTRQDIADYMAKRYTKKNIVVAASGNVNIELISEMIEKKLIVSDKKIEDKEGKYTIKSGKFAVVKKDIEQVHISMGLPGYAFTDKRKYAASVVNNVFGGTMSSRLFQIIREELGMAYSVFSYPMVYMHGAMTTIYAATNAQNAPRAAQEIVKEIERLRREGISEKELKNSKEQLRGSFILSREGTSAKMNFIGKNALLTGKVLTERDVLNSLANVTMADVEEVIDYVMDHSKLTATYVGAIKDEELLRSATDLQRSF